MTRRGIPMCRDWRVRYVDIQGKVTNEIVTTAPTKLFAMWNAKDYFGWDTWFNAHKVTCWPMR